MHGFRNEFCLCVEISKYGSASCSLWSHLHPAFKHHIFIISLASHYITGCLLHRVNFLSTRAVLLGRHRTGLLLQSVHKYCTVWEVSRLLEAISFIVVILCWGFRLYSKYAGWSSKYSAMRRWWNTLTTYIFVRWIQIPEGGQGCVLKPKSSHIHDARPCASCDVVKSPLAWTYTS